MSRQPHSQDRRIPVQSRVFHVDTWHIGHTRGKLPPEIRDAIKFLKPPELDKQYRGDVQIEIHPKQLAFRGGDRKISVVLNDYHDEDCTSRLTLSSLDAEGWNLAIEVWQSFARKMPKSWNIDPEGWREIEHETTAPNGEAQESSAKLPPVTNAIDKKILELVTDNPDLTDKQVGKEQGVNLTRQQVNTRRKRLKAMGYRVR